ncbi:hypothetical protein [Agromyces sp. NPDC058110]|uniref:hypothetical protein n=1 Tax=Agromyces sp. NPDC058110 TaxID=3346345 RepID=UPI0036DEAB8A
MPSSQTMVRMPRAAVRGVLAFAAAGLVAAALTGCVNPVEELVQNGVEDAIEGATGGDVSLGGELPAGFPAEIPIVEGKITVGIGTGDANGWVVVVDATEADPASAAASALEGAGFAEDTSMTQEQRDALMGGALDAKVYSNGTYLVLLAVQDSTVSYTVTPQ